MATPGGRTNTDLSQQLTREPQRFNFFQAVRLLERAGLKRSGTSSSGASRPVGEDEAPHDEIVRFQVPASFTFPSGEIANFAPPTEDRPAQMTVSFLGLTGPAGVLPGHYTQLVIERNRQKDFSLRDFLDAFHHRLIALFYRAWRKFRFYVGYERAIESGKPRTDDFTQALQALIGLGTAHLRDRQAVDDETWLYYAGQFSHAPRNVTSLSEMVADYQGVPVQIEQFVGQWLYLDRADQSNLQSIHTRTPANNVLGQNVVIGDRVWGIEQKFRLRLGPLPYAEFLCFLPRGNRLLRTAQFVRSYVGPEFDFDVQPLLRADEVPLCQLGGAEEPSRLGWNTWLRSRPVPHHADDAVFTHEGWPS